MSQPSGSAANEVKPRKPGKLIRFGICTAIVIAGLIIVIVSAIVSDRNQSNKVPVPPAPDVLVDIPCGRLAGRISRINNTTKVYEFINIPYAQPPTGERRWNRPESLKSKCWTNTLLANEVKVKMCPQLAVTSTMEVIGSEDCLYLSVRTPNMTGKLPVLVWIHGGGLLMGYNDVSGYSSDSEFTVAMDAVTVNINYRLGLLGFLSLKELWNTAPGSEAYGNYGIMDQIAALEWIKSNIASFGGNPSSVTVLGQSSGGSSVLALVGSPLANGLFHRAISLSAPIPRTNYTTLAADARDQYLSQIGCGSCTAEDLRKCLRSVPVAKIVNASWANTISMMGPYGFPNPGEQLRSWLTIDPVVLPRPLSLLNASSFVRAQPVPVLISTMAQEIGSSPQYRFGDGDWVSMYANMAEALSKFNKSLVETAFALYPNTSSANDTMYVPQLVYDTYVTDARWTCAANSLAEAIGSSANHSAYRLYITHRPVGKSSHHTWDAYALFGKYIAPTPHDRSLQDLLRSTVRRFAHEGALPVDWQAYPRVTAVFTDTSPWFEYRQGPVQKEQCEFWNGNGFAKYAT